MTDYHVHIRAFNKNTIDIFISSDKIIVEILTDL